MSRFTFHDDMVCLSDWRGRDSRFFSITEGSKWWDPEKLAENETLTVMGVYHDKWFILAGQAHIPSILDPTSRKIQSTQDYAKSFFSYNTDHVTVCGISDEGVVLHYKPDHTQSNKYHFNTSTLKFTELDKKRLWKGVAPKEWLICKHLPPLNGLNIQQYPFMGDKTPKPLLVRKATQSGAIKIGSFHDGQLISLNSPSRYSSRYFWKDSTYQQKEPQNRSQLFWRNTAGQYSEPQLTGLQSDIIWGVKDDPTHNVIWVYGENGISLYRKDRSLIKHFDPTFGLPGHRVMDCLIDGDSIFFTVQDQLKNKRTHLGGVAEYHWLSGTFTTIGVIDGLPSGHTRTISKNGDSLEITYDPETSLTYKETLSHPSQYTPSSRSFSDRKPLQEAKSAPAKSKPNMPLLGGSLLNESFVGSDHYFCGSRGVLAYTSSKAHTPPAPYIVHQSDSLVQDINWKKEADGYKFTQRRTQEDIEKWQQQANPHLLAKALKDLASPSNPTWWSLLVELSKHKNSAVSLAAKKNITRLPISSADQREIVLRLLESDHSTVSDQAALRLIESGIMPEPVSSGKRLKNNRLVYVALSKCPSNRLKFDYVVKYPTKHEGSEIDHLITQLTDFIQTDPQQHLIQLLDMNNDKSAESFLKRLGHSMSSKQGNYSDILLQTLQSNQEPKKRRNAALLCGYLGDTSTIPTLIETLKDKNYLCSSGAAIALGELKSVKAAPHIVQLYEEIKLAKSQPAKKIIVPKVDQALSDFEFDQNHLKQTGERQHHWVRNAQIGNSNSLKEVNTYDLMLALRSIGVKHSQHFFLKHARDFDSISVLELLNCPDQDRAEVVKTLTEIAKDHEKFFSYDGIHSRLSLVILGEDQWKDSIARLLKKYPYQTTRAMVMREQAPHTWSCLRNEVKTQKERFRKLNNPGYMGRVDLLLSE